MEPSEFVARFKDGLDGNFANTFDGGKAEANRTIGRSATGATTLNR
jgi:hypothetical protein